MTDIPAELDLAGAGLVYTARRVLRDEA